MVVVSIIGVIAAIAIPAFAKATRHARAMKMANDLRVIHDALNMYAMDHGQFPTAYGTVPEPVTLYLSNAKWHRPTALGGRWLYYAFAGLNLVVVDDLHFEQGQNPLAAVAAFEDVDKKMDDGNLSSGDLRLIGSLQMLYNVNEGGWWAEL